MPPPRLAPPLSLVTDLALAEILHRARRYGKATEESKKNIEMNPCSAKSYLIQTCRMVIFGGILVFSFYMTLIAGSRGFMPFDQSIIFDGSYRIISGQIPYKDFVIPIGPVAFWLQSIFFKLLGISYRSYIASAAVINLLATLCSMILVKRLFPSCRNLPYLAGILTAIWFYPPFGTPWIEQTSFFFILLAINFLLPVLFDTKLTKTSLIFSFIAGCLAFVAFLSKQNVGLFALPLYFLLLVISDAWHIRPLLPKYASFTTGIVISFTIFLVWIIFCSDFDMFVKYFFVIPGKLGEARLFGNWSAMLKAIVFGKGPPIIRSVFFSLILFASCMFFMYAYRRKKTNDVPRRTYISCILCISLIVFQNIFIYTTNNQPENGLPFIGIIMAIGIGLIFQNSNFDLRRLFAPNGSVGRLSKNITNLIVLVALLLIMSYISIYGINVSLNRKVHDLFENSEFQAFLDYENLDGLRWAQPTGIRGVDVKQEDIFNLLKFLESRDANFFIYRDFTILYGLLGVPSPQPVLWFHKGLTYPAKYDQNLDRWIVRELRKNDIQVVILEEKTLIGTENTLDDFPQLASYIEESFSKTRKIGIFNILERR